MATTIDFWYTIGSTYSYLSVTRLDAVARETGIPFVWRPFNVRAIMADLGNQPFVGKPAKMRYMWRDLERRANRHGIGIHVPAPYPLQDLDLANLVALVGFEEGWGEAYTQATYRRWFQLGQPPGERTNLSGSLADVGQDTERVINLAASDANAETWQSATAEAASLGIFGAPTFSVDGELFWGDDRLEDAICWFRNHQTGG